LWLDDRKQDMKAKTQRAFDTVCELASDPGLVGRLLKLLATFTAPNGPTHVPDWLFLGLAGHFSLPALARACDQCSFPLRSSRLSQPAHRTEIQ